MSVVKRASKKIVGYPEHGTEDISTKDWLSHFWTNPFPHVKAYFLNLFPIFTWILRYNFTWLYGDVIAGVTVGIVVVPQAMSFAQVAGLAPEFGLYSSIVGACIYCFFATSKDVTIGPTAVLSLTVAGVVKRIQEGYPGQWDNLAIAMTVGLTVGFAVLGIGFLRLGWLVEFIPMPAISGFMTGSAITIVAGQTPGLMGITGFDTRAATYKVIINTLRGLPRTRLDAAFGMTGLLALYGIREICVWGSKKWPHRARLCFVINVLRNAVILVVLTVAAWLYCRRRKDSNGNFPIKILKSIPPGLKHIAAPQIDGALISAMAPQIPVTAIIAFLEHISVAKTFGRMNGYKVNVSQELISIGVANTVGACFGAYASTGSFARSALLAKSGVCTPLSGIPTAIVVLVALYGLTQAFFWIPNSVLCAVIIHSVADLVASPTEVFRYWRFSPPEFFIWFATVSVILFMSIEAGIYVSVGASLALLLFRVAHPRGSFLGRVSLETDSGQDKQHREIFVPIGRSGIKVTPPAPGVLVYRFEESYLFPNCALVNSALVDYIREKMRRGKNLSAMRTCDRLWHDSGSRRSSGTNQMVDEEKPWLHAVVLDFSAVSQLDTTATQTLIDTRSEIERWTDYPVEFHFASILSPWIHRALVAGGFGYGISHSNVAPEVAEVGPGRGGRQTNETSSQPQGDVESDGIRAVARHHENRTELKGWETLLPQDTPFIHPDLSSAVRAAESGLDRVTTFGRKKLEEEEDSD